MSVEIKEVEPLKPMATTQLSTEPIFELTFKHGQMKEDLLFQAKDLQAAITIGNKYCKMARLRFITVTPFVQDLNAMIERLESEATT